MLKITEPIFKLFRRIAQKVRPNEPEVLCQFTEDNQVFTVSRDGWVIISNGTSTDAIPLICLSDAVINRVIAELESSKNLDRKGGTLKCGFS